MKHHIINRGSVIYLNYLFIQEHEVRVMNFIGLCTSRSNQSNSIIIINNIKKERIKLVMNLASPAIIKLVKLKKYKNKFRLNKLFYK
jgi:ribosomal protein L19